MRRGCVVAVAVSGDYGKPRPAIVIQSDWLHDTDIILVCLLTTTIRDAPLYRITIPPGLPAGLRRHSQIMLDNIMAVRRDRIGQTIGSLAPGDLIALNRGLAVVIGIGDLDAPATGRQLV